MKPLKAVSLFSGCGGFDLGVSKSGVDIIMANDIDHDAAVAYQSIFPNTQFVEKDVRLIKMFPSADILIGCYPCTGFSGAARRRWKHGEDRDLTQNDKNFLFQEFLRAIDAVKPKLIFIENVRGMLSANDGYFLKQQLDGFRSRGFENIEPMILNAADYGVAQTRERVFFVGFHKRVGPVSFAEPKATYGKGTPRVHRALQDVIGDLPEWPDGEFHDGPFHGHYLTRNRKRAWSQPSFTIVADGHHVPLHPGGEPMSFVSKDKWRLNGDFNRRLSWRECLRIQGLPERMNAGETLWDKYRVIGNSVPPRLAQRLSSRAISTLGELL
ncbi:MAG: DNA (cytosine-5-)-methyltransferase [Flavobacteriales bacterium]|nr:DNA (cytosine-5-)-methyltransferase [Flavobacteriales bacterium]MBK7940936.1 DNA (cytosine-5-)-methyltransferase [Flavobacteriales bacterium]MBK8948416.1 DNA (cytosine-5-)-methyltransferase [Flavobacteriales bacterium]MBK9701641.1 DNA (cytosine-5-)-methyltransferase [Flavobacteriales bacterium]